MADRSLLRALGASDDGADANPNPSIAIRVTRTATRRSQGATMDTATPEAQTIASRPKRSIRIDSKSPQHNKRIANPAAETPAAPSNTERARPAVNSGAIITSSANDRDIAGTLARMQQYLEHEDQFKGKSARVRRDIVKGLKSSFGNRYNGRCTKDEKMEFIARWVKLAGVHNQLLTSEMEKESLGIKIDPKLLKQQPEVIVLD